MNINSINVSKHPISQIFDVDSKSIYEIPKYQREYVWGPGNLEALYDDLYNNDEGHFLGSIICINSTKDSLSELKFEVVDGQQRLTTICLFLSALFHVLGSFKENLNEDQEDAYKLIKKRLVLRKTKADIRLIPQIQKNNNADFKALLKELGIIDATLVTPKNAGNRRIYRAYYYFVERINSELEQFPDNDKKIECLINILDKVNTAILVVIEVSNHSDAYTLFEALNNRGIPLTAIDLIKNTLLSKLDAIPGTDIGDCFAKWEQMLNCVGDDYTVQERFFRQNYNAFRKEHNVKFGASNEHPYPLGTLATKSNILGIYEKLVAHDPENFLNKICENANVYSWILLNDTTGLNTKFIESMTDLQRVQGAPAYALLLFLLKDKDKLSIQDDTIVLVIQLLVKFFVRRNVTDTPPTRDLIRLFNSVIEGIEKENKKDNAIYLYIKERLENVTANDIEFENKLKDSMYLENSGMTRFILCMLAKQGMTRETERDLWKKNDKNQYIWTIEHIFPQGENIPDCWIDMIANVDKEKAKEYQQEYVHTFGNLTISGYNSNLGNKSFEYKKERKDDKGAYIGYRNGITLNDDVVRQSKWTTETIKNRTNSMVKNIMSMLSL